jgi:predicted enzyme related to lactoylglutathione lyase
MGNQAGRDGAADPGLRHAEVDRPPEPDASRIHAHADAALYFACADVDAAYSQLRTKGIRLGPPATTSYGMRQLHFKDPDGYAICLQQRAS